MAEALEWGLYLRPSPTITGGGTDQGGAEPIAKLGEWTARGDFLPRQQSNYSDAATADRRTHAERGYGERAPDEPSFAVTSKGFSWLPNHRLVMPNSDETEFDPTERPAPTVTGKSGTQSFGLRVRSTRGQPKDVPRNGHHTFDPLERPSHTVTTQTGDWEVTVVPGWVYDNGGRENSARRDVGAPAPTIHFGHRVNRVEWVWVGEGEPPEPPEWVFERPATTIVGSWHPDLVAAPGWRTEVSRYQTPGSVRVTVGEAAVLQTFPADYPWQGNKGKQFLQVGNAVPPTLAEAVLRQLIDN